MTIWILAILLMTTVALAGWRQGAIRAAFSFVGILFAGVLAAPVGRLVHPILPHVGASNPFIAWALAPIAGFFLVTIVFAIAAQPLHHRVEHFYKYNAGDLRLALWTRLNSRLGICLGLLNGALCFIFACFLIFNLTYWTIQVSTAPNKPVFVRLVNQLGNDLQATGLARTATAVGTLSPSYYQLADLSGFILQQKDPQFGQRLVEYPALTSLWEREDMVPLVTDPTLTNVLVSGTTLGEIFADPNVKSFLGNKDQSKMVFGIIQSNLDDFTEYLKTGKSAKYDGEKIIGRWEFNPAVTIAWLRQSRPKIPASEMRAVRAWMMQAYAQTRLLATGDNQLFVKSLPRLKTVAGQPPTTENNDWKGDWTANGTNYDLHLTFSGEDKFLTASAEALRLTLKDGKNLMIFDRAD